VPVRPVQVLALLLTLHLTSPFAVDAAPGPGHAQRSSGSVRGVVVDAQTGQPLARARVRLERGAVRVETNADGRFLLSDVEAGAARLEVSLVGYGLARRDIEIPAGGSLELTIPLSEGTSAYTEEVHVSGELYRREEPGVANQIAIGSAELQNLRSMLADDPVRAVQSLPGVGGSDEFRSELSVRGSGFRHVGVTLDGVPTPLLVHTVRHASDTGSLAMINSDILDGVALAAGSYPQRFGNRTGAQLDFRTRDGSRARPMVRLAVSAINASIVAEGPLGSSQPGSAQPGSAQPGSAKRGSWLISARKSYIDWLIRRIDPQTTGAFGFVDTQGKVVYDLTPRHTLTVNVVAGRSRYDEHDPSPGRNSLEVGRNRSLLAGATWRWTPSPRFVATQRVYSVASRFSNRNAALQPIEDGLESDVSYRGDVTATGPRAMLFEGGVHVQRLHASGDSHIYEDESAVAHARYTGTFRRVGGYGLVRLRPARMLTISPGVRVDNWELTGETLASPWMQAELALPGSMLVAAGAGLYRQSPEIAEVKGAFGNPDPRTERARHIDVGVGQQIGPYRWQITAFSRAEANVVRPPSDEPRRSARLPVFVFPFPWPYENVLEGVAHGLEASLQRRSLNGLSGWIGYAFASARYDDRRQHESYPADEEQRHMLTVYAHHRLSSRLSVSARLRAGTNTPLAGYLQRVDDRYFLSRDRNQTRLPFYSRLDLRGNRTFDVAGGRLTLFIEIINAWNRRNLRGREHYGVDSRTGQAFGVTEKLFPIVPSAGFLLEF
jgi:hypothetical protein